MSGPRSFQLKAGVKWEIKSYKNRLVIAMNRHPGIIRQPVTPYDVLNVRHVRELAAWLNRYLHMVEPTQESEIVAGMRSHSRGIERNLTKLESQRTHSEQSFQNANKQEG